MPSLGNYDFAELANMKADETDENDSDNNEEKNEE